MNIDGVSLVVTTYYRPLMLEKVLDSIINIERADLPVEVIIVRDKGDSDASLILKRYMSKGSSGFSFREIVINAVNVDVARNAGIRSSRYKLVGVIDDDVLVNPLILRNTLNILGKKDKVAGVCFPALSDNPGFNEKIYYYRYLDGVYWDFPAVTPVTFFDKNILEKTGFYREDMGPPISIHEDWELGSRIRKNGYRLVFDGRIKNRHLLSMRKKGVVHISLMGLLGDYISSYFKKRWWSFLQVLKSSPMRQLVKYLGYFVYPWIIIALLILNPLLGLLLISFSIIAVWLYSFVMGYYRVMGFWSRLYYMVLIYLVRIVRTNIAFAGLIYNIVLNRSR